MFDKTPAATLDYHRSLLTDTARTGALGRAIRASVNQGDSVLDLGCGSGVLICFACRAGARRVYAIESEPIIELARSLVRANGFSDRVVFINELSTRAQLPERVDVVVTETIGNLGLEEGILGWTLDARRRFLKPGGFMIPRSIALRACPVELPAAYDAVSAWGELPYGLDFSAGQRFASHNPAWVEIPAGACLADPANLGRIDLTRHATDGFSARIEITASRSGICHGLGSWFEAELTASESIDNAPPLPCPSWRHGFLPLDHPLPIRAGEHLVLELRAEVNGSLWLWSIAGANSAVEAHAPLRSTIAGRFLSMQTLRKGAAGYIPRLSPGGEARAHILRSMDGCRSIIDIAEEAAEQFPNLFKDREDALNLVRKLARSFG